MKEKKKISVLIFAITILISVGWGKEKLTPVRHSDLYTLEVLMIQTSHEGARLINPYLGNPKDENDEFIQPNEDPEKRAKMQQRLQDNIVDLVNRKDTTIIRFPLLYLKLDKREHVEQWGEIPSGTTKERKLNTVNPDNKRPGRMLAAKLTESTANEKQRYLLTIRLENVDFNGWDKYNDTKRPIIRGCINNTEITSKLNEWIIIGGLLRTKTNNSKDESQISKDATINVFRINKPLQ